MRKQHSQQIHYTTHAFTHTIRQRRRGRAMIIKTTIITFKTKAFIAVHIMVITRMRLFTHFCRLYMPMFVPCSKVYVCVYVWWIKCMEKICTTFIHLTLIMMNLFFFVKFHSLAEIFFCRWASRKNIREK